MLDLACTKELYRIIAQGHFQVVATHSTKAGLLGRLAAALARVPLIIFTAHGFSFNEPSSKAKHHFMVLQEKLGARLGDHIIAVSDFDRRAALAKGICKEAEITTVHNGIDIRALEKIQGFRKEDIGLPRDSRVVGTIANFYPNKGLGFFVDAFATAAGELKNTHAVMVGDGPMMAEIRAQVQSKGLAKRVDFFGYRDDATRFLSAFDVFVLSSVKEGFPWALLEAMAFGKPVAATKVGGVAEMVGETAMLVPPRDIHALASAISELSSDRRRSSSLGEAARETVLQNFTLDRMIEKTEQLYLSLLDGRHT